MNVACFDIGGTFVKYSVINQKGEILFRDKLPTPNKDGKTEIPRLLTDKIKDMSLYFKIDSVGISTAGQVDSQKGEIIFATDNIPGYTGAKLSSHLRYEFNLPSYVENDVNAAAMGEMWMGAAKGKKNFLCITLGTGIGGAIVIDRKLYKGVNGGAGELGHMVINYSGERCRCGLEGCFERYASTSALVRAYQREMESSSLKAQDVNGELIMDKVRSGDAMANRIYSQFLEHLATGVASAVHILDPGFVVIGGGISAQGDVFLEEFTKVFKQKVMKSYADKTEIALASLKNDAGVLGAAYLSLNTLRKL